MIRNTLFLLLLVLSLIAGCNPEDTSRVPATEEIQPPVEIPEGILVKEIPEGADIIFTSIRYVLNDLKCLDENYNVKDNFINDPECNRLIYNPDGQLASPRQLFAMDLATGKIVQLTNTDHFFVNAQVINATTIVALAAYSDTDGNGFINEQDGTELYLLDLVTGNMVCLTDELGLTAINNPDYSHVREKIVFSAQKSNKFHNYLFTIDADKNLTQITDDDGYMDFDCAWSEDGTKIVFNRLPLPIFTEPSQIWMMDADGTNTVKITDGGFNPGNEENLGSFPIGTDADPDLSPDNKQIVFSRLMTGKQNEPLGVWELIVIDLETKKEKILDSQYANMIPEWKTGGILFIRQQSVADFLSRPMDVKQSLYLYKNESFTELEDFPYNVFPVGAYGASWIE